jgi:hypothetical protein
MRGTKSRGRTDGTVDRARERVSPLFWRAFAFRTRDHDELLHWRPSFITTEGVFLFLFAFIIRMSVLNILSQKIRIFLQLLQEKLAFYGWTDYPQFATKNVCAVLCLMEEQEMDE